MLLCRMIALAAALLLALPLLTAAQDEAPVEQPELSREQMLARIKELIAQERELSGERRKLTARVSEIQIRVRTLRERALRSDPELKALQDEIDKNQAELERLLEEKNEGLANLMQERDEFTVAYTELSGKITEVRRERKELTTRLRGQRPPRRPPAREGSGTPGGER